MSLRLRYVAGVSPAKWLRAWAERRPDLPLDAQRVDEPDQLRELRAGEADLAFVRLPVDDEGLHAIPLWEEVAVVVLPKEHDLAEADELHLADLDGLPEAPAQSDAAMTMELVAAGTGYAIMPHGLARLHHRRDVAAVLLADAAPTRIALVWPVERDDDDIQEFVGIVRGRTARSSRGATADAEPAPAGSRHRDGRRAAKGGAQGGRRGAGTARRGGRGTGRRGGRGR
ncbi:LysR substrate-binding domain-containing protein [Agromyces sp. SYSU T0242]|uniref:LysR substrate-binding domain-containing protein n=1 Tax=Agromyces litoreus TaxID=3158561 RepID=UPI003391636E